MIQGFWFLLRKESLFLPVELIAHGGPRRGCSPGRKGTEWPRIGAGISQPPRLDVIPPLCSFAAALWHVRRDKGHVKVSAGPRAFLSLPLWSPPGLIKDPQASGCKSELHSIFCKHLHGASRSETPRVGAAAPCSHKGRAGARLSSAARAFELLCR